MTAIDDPQVEICNCAAQRQASRRVTQFYDRHLVAAGPRTTQVSILAKLRGLGPMTVNALAEKMVMDRTTVGRNIGPLEREGLVAVRPGYAAFGRNRGLDLRPLMRDVVATDFAAKLAPI